MAAYVPVPRMAVYSAAKAFVLSFTEALWYEHRATDLRVLALSPSATRTEFFDTVPQAASGQRLWTPQQVVETALRTLDRRNPTAQHRRRQDAVAASSAVPLTLPVVTVGDGAAWTAACTIR